MLSKVVVGSGFAPVLKYIMGDEKRAKLITSNGVRDFNYKLTTEDFEMNRQQIPSINQAVFHAILSFPHKEKHSKEMLKTLSEEYMEALGFKDAPFLVIEHNDKKHQHLHVVSSFIDLYGHRVNNSWIGLRGKKVAQTITEKYGLTPANKKHIGQINLNALNDKEKLKYQAFMVINSAIKKSKTFNDLEKQLIQHGISVQYKLKRGSREIQGISFNVKDKYLFKGSEIDSTLSYSKIEQSLAKNSQEKIKLNNVEIQKQQSSYISKDYTTNENIESKSSRLGNIHLSLDLSLAGKEYFDEKKKNKKIRKRGPRL